MKWFRVFLITILFLSACSIISFSENKTITFISTQTDLKQKEVQELIAKEFESNNPGIKVNVEYLSWSDVYAKVITGYKVGALPEVSTPDPSPLFTFAARGLLLPLDDVLEEIGLEDFYMEGLQQSEYQGHYYGVPYRLQAMVLYYRKDLFKEKNLNPPTTWNEWLEAARILTEDTDGDGVIDRWGCVLPYGRTGWTDTQLLYLTWMQGGSFFDESNNITFNTPQVRTGLEFLKKMFPYSPIGSETYTYYDSINAFITGKAAMSVYYGRLIPTMLQDAPELKDKVGAVLIPIPEEGGKRVFSIGAGMLTVFKDSKYPDLGKEFVKSFLNSKYFADFCNATPLHAIPARKSTADSASFRDNEVIKAYPEILETLQEALGYSVSEAKETDGILNPYWGEIRDSSVFQDAIQKVVLLDEPIEDVVKWVEDTVKEMQKSLQ